MTINSTIRKAGPYTGTGAVSAFPFAFKVFGKTDILVVRTDTAGVESVLAVDSDYTVAINANQNANPGGVVTLPSALASGFSLTITSSVPNLQPTDLTNNGGFFPEVLNAAFDRIVIQIQQLAEQLGRTLKFSVSSPLGASALPDPVANHVIGWNSTANGFSNFAPVDNTLLGAALGAPGGSALVGFRQPAAAATPRTLQAKAQDLASVEDYGATAGASDNLAFVQAAIDAAQRGDSILVPDGRRYNVSAAPNNSKGVRFVGTGKIVAPTPISQVNTYRYDRPVAINKEHLYRVYEVIQNTNRAIQCFAYGDSTIAGGLPYIDWGFFLQALLPDMVSARGVRNYFNVTNRGVGGSNITAWNPLPDIGGMSGADLVIVKYGINDAFPDATRLDTFESTLRAKLAQIRAQLGGDVTSCAILLVGPNAVWDEDFDARNSRWFESLRSIYEAAARDYKCAYFDTYAYLLDASYAAGKWLDKPNVGNNTALHPKNIGQSWIWGAIVDWMFGDSEVMRWSTNKFHNKSQYFGFPKASTAYYPNNYDPGQTLEVALSADGWPVNGILWTIKSSEGPLLQHIYSLTENGSILTRYANPGGNYFGQWRGQQVPLSLLNSWIWFGVPYQPARAMLDASDVVTLDGAIRPGVTAAGTVLFSLPLYMAPVTQRILLAASDSGVCQIEIFTNGDVQLRSGVPATWLSLTGINFSR